MHLMLNLKNTFKIKKYYVDMITKPRLALSTLVGIAKPTFGGGLIGCTQEVQLPSKIRMDSNQALFNQ